MKKCEIVDYVINKTELSQSQANKAVESVFDAIHNALRKGESVYIRGLATFKVYKTKERKAQNINKGTAVLIPARLAVKFIPGKELKKELKG